jgi:hypothetical protein
MKKLFLFLSAVCCLSLYAENAFLDQKKQLIPSQEWNHEIICKNQSEIRLKISGEGPFSVTFVTDALHTAIIKRDGDAMKSLRKGFSFSVDSPEPVYERTLHLEPGDYWLIIRNNLKRDAEIHLECFEITNRVEKISGTETNSPH